MGQAASSSPDLAGRRALPTTRRRWIRLDLAMLASALVMLGTAATAYLAVDEPWVRLAITDTGDDVVAPLLVGDIALRGQGALVGTIAMALAIAVGAIGFLCLVHGFDRGSTMRWFANPVIAMTSAIGGLGIAVVSAVLWFVWADAAIGRARAVRMSADELKALLDEQPAPIVEIQQLAGLTRFGAAMLLALLAASAAWWAYRKRA
jgi:hypothetical protein